MVTNRLKFSLKSRNQKKLCIQNNKPKTIPHTHARTLVRIAYLLEIHGVARLICSYSPNHLDTGEWPVHLVANVTFYFSPSRAIVLDIRIVNYFLFIFHPHTYTRARTRAHTNTHTNAKSPFVWFLFLVCFVRFFFLLFVFVFVRRQSTNFHCTFALRWPFLSLYLHLLASS